MKGVLISAVALWLFNIEINSIPAAKDLYTDSITYKLFLLNSEEQLNPHQLDLKTAEQRNSLAKFALSPQKESLDQLQMDECLDDPVICFVVVRYKNNVPVDIYAVRDGVQKQ
jgi:hypothetical protein